MATTMLLMTHGEVMMIHFSLTELAVTSYYSSMANELDVCEVKIIRSFDFTIFGEMPVSD